MSRSCVVPAGFVLLFVFLVGSCSSPLSTPDTSTEDGDEQTVPEDSSDETGNAPNDGSSDDGDSDPPPPPPPVSGLTAHPGDGLITLTWTNPTAEDFSNTLVAWEPDGATPTEVPGDVATLPVDGLTNDREYSFTVTAVYVDGAQSTAVTITATPVAPTPVPDASNLVAIEGDGRVVLTWTDPVAPTNPDEAQPDEMLLTWDPGGSSPTTVALGQETFTATALENGVATTFLLRVKAADARVSAGTYATATPGVFAAPDLAAEDDTGVSDTDNLTNLATGLTFVGDGLREGTIIDLHEGSVGAGTATVASDGSWSIDTDLGPGIRTVTYEVSTQEGVSLGVSGALQIEIDQTAPSGVPRLLRPRNGFNTGVDLTPRFAWDDVSDGDLVEIQADESPEFADPAYTWSYLTGTSFEPGEEMSVATTTPVGTRYYLRIRAVDAAGNLSEWSDTDPAPPHRYVNVGRFDGDFNGDGYADILAGDYYHNDTSDGQVYMFYGGPRDTFDTTPDLTIDAGATGDRLGLGLSYVGDVNNDGFQDFVAGAVEAGDEGTAYLFLGDANRTITSVADADLVIDNPRTSIRRFGKGISAAGDVDADGYDDFLIGSYYGYTSQQSGGYPSYVGLYLGGNAPDGAADAGVEVEQSGWYTTQTSYVHDFSIHPGRAGDLNGDGYADFVVGRPWFRDPDFAGPNGRLEVYLGGPSISATPTPDVLLTGTEVNEHFGVAAYGAGDLNNDGYDDLIAGTDRGEARLFFGAEAFNPAGPDVTFVVPDSHSGWTNNFDYTYKFGVDIAPLGDFNGDGIDDLLIGAPQHTGQVTSHYGAWTLYYGRASWPGTVDMFDRWGLGSTQNRSLGDSMAGTGDVDGDGLQDMIVGAWGRSGLRGRARFHFGMDGPLSVDHYIDPSGNENFSMDLGRAW
ncbi:MAG: fibronectin type III domain-containing protein [bacterium]